MKKYLLEGMGTMLLVLICCGVAVVSGVNLWVTSLIFGMVLFLLILVIGPATGCHINPAVSFAMALKKNITWKQFALYVVSQFAGALVGSILLFAFLGFTGTGANGLGGMLYSGYVRDVWEVLVPVHVAVAIVRAFVVEVILTLIFVGVIIVATTKMKNKVAIAFVIGVTLVVVHLIGINLTGTSVNPARSFGPAVVEMFQANWNPIMYFPIFLVAPMLGAFLAVLLTNVFFKKAKACCEPCASGADCECHEPCKCEEKQECGPDCTCGCNEGKDCKC